MVYLLSFQPPPLHWRHHAHICWLTVYSVLLLPPHTQSESPPLLLQPLLWWQLNKKKWRFITRQSQLMRCKLLQTADWQYLLKVHFFFLLIQAKQFSWHIVIYLPIIHVWIKMWKNIGGLKQSIKKVNDSFELKPNTRNFVKISFNAPKKNCTETKVYTS